MMHIAWNSIENASNCFSRSSAKFQGHTGKKIAVFDPNWKFSDCNSSLNSPMAAKWCTKLEKARKGAALFFKVIYQISGSHGTKNHRFLAELGVSGLYLQFEFTDGYEMMHKAWSRIKDVPYCFSMSSVNFKVAQDKKKSPILTRIGRFRTVTPVWIHRWQRNDAHSLK